MFILASGPGGAGGASPEGDNAAPAGLLLPGVTFEGAAYIETLAPAAGAENTLLVNGHEEFTSQVWGDRVLRAPVTGEPCLYYRLEVTYETPDVNYHILTDISRNQLYVRAGGTYIAVDQVKRGGRPVVVKTFRPGQEPPEAPVPAHNWPEMTYRVWLLKPGVEYKVRVQKFGSALPPEEPGGEPTFKTYYHFTFRP